MKIYQFYQILLHHSRVAIILPKYIKSLQENCACVSVWRQYVGGIASQRRSKSDCTIDFRAYRSNFVHRTINQGDVLIQSQSQRCHVPATHIEKSSKPSPNDLCFGPCPQFKFDFFPNNHFEKGNFQEMSAGTPPVTANSTLRQGKAQNRRYSPS